MFRIDQRCLEKYYNIFDIRRSSFDFTKTLMLIIGLIDVGDGRAVIVIVDVANIGYLRKDEPYCVAAGKKCGNVYRKRGIIEFFVSFFLLINNNAINIWIKRNKSHRFFEKIF